MRSNIESISFLYSLLEQFHLIHGMPALEIAHTAAPSKRFQDLTSHWEHVRSLLIQRNQLAPDIGRLVAERYLTLKSLRRGAQADAVQLAYDIDSRDFVILKAQLRNGQGSERHLREFRIGMRLNKLRNPNLISTHTRFETLHHAWIVSGMVGSHIKSALPKTFTLKDAVEGFGVLTPRQSFEVFIQLLCAVRAVQSLRIVHRDIKPQNTALYGAIPSAGADPMSSSLALIDLGLAKSLVVPWYARSATNPCFDSDEGIRVGTRGFTDPLVYNGEPADLTTDLYAICATYYYCCTGRSFTEQASVSHLKVSEALGRILGRCLSRHRTRRISNAESLAEELQGCPESTEASQSYLNSHEPSATAVTHIFGEARIVPKRITQADFDSIHID